MKWYERHGPRLAAKYPILFNNMRIQCFHEFWTNAYKRRNSDKLPFIEIEISSDLELYRIDPKTNARINIDKEKKKYAENNKVLVRTS